MANQANFGRQKYNQARPRVASREQIAIAPSAPLPPLEPVEPVVDAETSVVDAETSVAPVEPVVAPVKPAAPVKPVKAPRRKKQISKPGTLADLLGDFQAGEEHNTDDD
jgi:hypothetical protein